MKHSFLFPRIFPNEDDIFPGIFENPAPAVKTSGKLNNIFFNKNIMKYQLYTNALKKIDDYRL